MEEKNKTIIYSICILILLALCVLVTISGLNLSCDKCSVLFNQDRQAGMAMDKQFYVDINDLYGNFTQNKSCIIEWIKGYGFMDKRINGNITI